MRSKHEVSNGAKRRNFNLDTIINLFTQLLSGGSKNDVMPKKDKVYYVQAPATAPMPYIVFNIEEIDEIREKCGVIGAYVTVRFDLYDTEQVQTIYKNKNSRGHISSSGNAGGGFMQDIGAYDFLQNQKDEKEKIGFLIADMELLEFRLDKADTIVFRKTYVYRYMLQFFNEIKDKHI